MVSPRLASTPDKNLFTKYVVALKHTVGSSLLPIFACFLVNLHQDLYGYHEP